MGNCLFDWDGLGLLRTDLIEATKGFHCPEASIFGFEQGIQAFSETICKNCPGVSRKGQRLLSELLDRNPHRAKIASLGWGGKRQLPDGSTRKRAEAFAQFTLVILRSLLGRRLELRMPELVSSCMPRNADAVSVSVGRRPGWA